MSLVVPTEWNYFALFETPENLTIDESALRAKFYALSRAYHPDRWATASFSERAAATDWTAHINEGYETLKSREDRFKHLCEVLHLPLAPVKAGMPAALTELYFEAQEAEDPEAKKSVLARVRSRLKELEDEWTSWCDRWNTSSERASLVQKMQDYFTEARYLRSMENSLKREVG